MKFRTIYLVLLCAWMLDFTTTFIGLNFFNNIYEVNKMPEILISLGWYGWILLFLVGVVSMFLMAWLIFAAINIATYVLMRKNKSTGSTFMIWYLPISMFIVNNIVISIHNIDVIHSSL